MDQVGKLLNQMIDEVTTQLRFARPNFNDGQGFGWVVQGESSKPLDKLTTHQG